MCLAHGFERRYGIIATRHRKTAAWTEGATVIKQREIRRLTFDGDQPFAAALIEARNRSQQTKRIGMAGATVHIDCRSSFDGLRLG